MPLRAEDHLPGVDLHDRRELVGEHEREQQEQLPLPGAEHHEVGERQGHQQHHDHRRGGDRDRGPRDVRVERVREHLDVVVERVAAIGARRELHDAHLHHDQERHEEQHDEQGDGREQDAEGAARAAGASRAPPGAAGVVLRTDARRRAFPAAQPCQVLADAATASVPAIRSVVAWSPVRMRISLRANQISTTWASEINAEIAFTIAV